MRSSSPERRARHPLGLALALLLASSAAAEPPRAHVPVLSSPPTIDGRLDDAVWEEANELGALVQVEPFQGEAPTERTVVRIARDAQHLYQGIRCYDREPEKIIRQVMLRDAEVLQDDRISIAIDTFRDLRNGYLLQVNPNGTRRDGIFEDGTLDADWDGIWTAKARVDDQGWTAEIALPFKTVSFDPDGDEWGFNLLRAIRRHDERLRWADPYPDKSFLNMADAGVLTGMRGIEQGVGLDVVPTLTLRRVDDPDASRHYTRIEPGLDAFYKLTTGITSAVTVNTDFGEAEVDDRQVNLTRFDLFFPEKRDFFLQDAGIFDFAGIEENARPFFSRRIGISASGEPVGLHVGGKVTGRAGPIKLGLLDVYTDSNDGVPERNLAVTRVAANVMRESTLGAIATFGDPLSDRDNYLVGGDFNFRDSEWIENRVVAGNLWYQQSFTPDRSKESAFGAEVSYPNDRVNWRLAAREIQRDFFPALGFVNRADIRRYEGSYRLRSRGTGWRRIVETEGIGFLVTNTSGALETAQLQWRVVDFQNDAGDSVELIYDHVTEHLDVPFLIRPDVAILPGRYHWERGGVKLTASPARPLSGQIDVAWGGFFDGTLLRLAPTLVWRPSRFVFLQIGYVQNRVRLSKGRFVTHLANARVNFQFSPDVSWNTLIQYDNLSDDLGLQSRLRWIVEPGREVFLVFNQDFGADDDPLVVRRSEPLLKLGWTLRF